MLTPDLARRVPSSALEAGPAAREARPHCRPGGLPRHPGGPSALPPSVPALLRVALFSLEAFWMFPLR